MNDDYFMQQALRQAQTAFDADEVPVGAVVVIENKIVSRGYNQVELLADPTAHAEMIALTSAFNFLGSKYLPDATIYVTVEPCLMCAGAFVHARIGTVVYGAAEPRTGALESTVRGGELPGHNHRFAVVGGVRSEECRSLIQEFFRLRR